MNSFTCTLPMAEIARIQIYVNHERKPLSRIVQEEAPDFAVTGTFYKSDWTAACHLRGDAMTYSNDPSYNAYGYSWETGPDLRMELLPAPGRANYISACTLIRSREPLSPLYYNPDVGGRRGRAAMGIRDGWLLLFACADGGPEAKTPEELRDHLMGCESAIMLDGGGKVNFYGGGSLLEGPAVSQNLLLVYRKKEDASVKICLDAGHGLHTAGKRCLKALDPSETREWVLNSRTAEHVTALLKEYDCEIIRTDDPSGETDISLTKRCAKANEAKADYFVSIHHNAGINGGKGGGIVVFAAQKASEKSYVLQRAIYDAVIAKTGLRGNRAIPLAKANFTVLTDTKMPAVLGEFGFMDSQSDVPVILTDAFSRQCAQGIAEALVSVAGLSKKPQPPVDERPGKLYRVQTGAFRNRDNAAALAEKLKAQGYDTIIKEE